MHLFFTKLVVNSLFSWILFAFIKSRLIFLYHLSDSCYFCIIIQVTNWDFLLSSCWCWYCSAAVNVDAGIIVIVIVILFSLLIHVTAWGNNLELCYSQTKLKHHLIISFVIALPLHQNPFSHFQKLISRSNKFCRSLSFRLCIPFDLSSLSQNIPKLYD